MIEEDILEKATQNFAALTCKPENYLSIQENVVPKVKELTKDLYDFTKKGEVPSLRSNALPELIIQDFDEEQIWQEIELQNEDKWNNFLSNVSMILAQKDDFKIPVTILNDYDSKTRNSNDSDKDDSEPETSDIQMKKKAPIKKTKKLKVKKIPEINKNNKGSIVDDTFFKLNELEAFLDAQDKVEMNKTRKHNKSNKKEESSEDDEEEEEIDLFANFDSEDEGMMDEEDTDSKQIKYKDFFENDSKSEESEEEDIPLNQEGLAQSDDLGFDDDDVGDEYQNTDDEIDLREVKGGGKKVRFDMAQPSSDDDESSNDGIKDSLKKEATPEDLSELQLRQQRLKKKISHLENNMFEEKSWPMKGEVTATNRPQNSLLEELVDFESTSRPAPIITEETTLKLQDIIIQRIKDKAWDDVERKFKPVEDIQEFKKQLVLDQEKSKLSLAQVYEQEYIKQREAMDPDADETPEEEPKEHKEIRSLLTALFTKLDALCNYHYTPKIAAPEVKIISNIPAINMEEVAPVATSDATLLAPEEIRGKLKGDIIGKTERTDTDKKRERRHKKLRQREREKERQKKEKVLDKINPGLGNKYSRNKASKLLEKVTKDRNVDKMVTMGDGKSLKSSSAFFSQLQEEVSSSIKSTLKRANKKTKNHLSAKKIKL